MLPVGSPWAAVALRLETLCHFTFRTCHESCCMYDKQAKSMVAVHKLG